MQDLIGKLVKDELNMIEIQGGTLMEDALKEQVYIPTFYISKLPITFEVWNAIMNEERQCPFHRIEWDEYKQFIKQLKDLTNINFLYLHITNGNMLCPKTKCLEEIFSTQKNIYPLDYSI